MLLSTRIRIVLCCGLGLVCAVGMGCSSAPKRETAEIAVSNHSATALTQLADVNSSTEQNASGNPPIRLASTRVAIDSASDETSNPETSNPIADDGGDAPETIPTPDEAEFVENTDDDTDPTETPRLISPPMNLTDSDAAAAMPLQRVVASVQGFFPLIEVAYLERARTSGDQLASWGQFDTKLFAGSENQPLGYYENYRHDAGAYQPLYHGGEVYAQYRLGRGDFEPWYKERETNDGGEFKTGFQVPLLKNNEIDARRADLWRATYDRQLAEPAIRREVITTIRDATIAYWVWIAAGQQYEIGKAALEFANRRNRQIQRRVEEGDLAPPELADNQRAIIQRTAKLVDLERKLAQSAIKLSLYVRDLDANPYVATKDELATFPEIVEYDVSEVQNDVTYAVRNRPELVELDTLVRRLQVDLAEAYNDTLPVLDATSNLAQDVGGRASPKNDKQPLELELGFRFEMPVQRRKGLGKMRATRAKMNQTTIKRRYQVDKIATEVQSAAAALQAAYQRVQGITQAVEISEDLAQVERRRFDLGDSDLLAVFLREQFAIEAASDLIFAKLEYFVARAEYTAALAYEFPIMFVPPESTPE